MLKLRYLSKGHYTDNAWILDFLRNTISSNSIEFNIFQILKKITEVGSKNRIHDVGQINLDKSWYLKEIGFMFDLYQE